jgi:pimeloyl-ACP methyl ester carboxylesterase/O-acetyl-ADP-ribose deacetylase (regulator of RNase III)
MRSAIIFIHGIFSSAAAWDDLIGLLKVDPDISENYDFKLFEYKSSYVNLSLTKRLPDFNVLADRLNNYMATQLSSYDKVVLVTHSQGGLIAQRYLARALDNGKGAELARVVKVVMFACPNNGSDLLLTLRRSAPFLARGQERETRPLTDSVIETQRRVLNGIVYATGITATSCPIPIVCYAGDSDGVVLPSSATSVFPLAGVVTGDHKSLIRPDSSMHESFISLKSQLMESLNARTRHSAGATMSWNGPGSEAQDVFTELWTAEPISIPVSPRQQTTFIVHAGPADQLSDVDIFVTSENVYLQMAMTFKPSVSGRLRRAAAKKSPVGEIIEDVAADELTVWLREHGRYGLPVEIGTVAPTSAGELEEKGIRRIYHAAIGIPRPGSDSFYTEPQGVANAVHNTFELARRESANLDVPLRSVCFPLLGAGLGNLDPVQSFNWMWKALVSELRRDPSYSIHFITWLTQETSLLLSELKRKAKDPG